MIKGNTLTVSVDHVRTVEHGIRPPMRQAVTLPILHNGRQLVEGGTIYISTSDFAFPRISDAELIAIAEEVARKLNLDT